ncbi:MAG: helix-turn-helix domain-containing protein [bacterium]|nr:helix-turn-helix domain-containing protein [bacterium]
MSMYGMSDRAILKTLGDRLRSRRLDMNLTQQKLAGLAGLDRMTVGNIERGVPTGMLSFVQVLRALSALDELDALLPNAGPSPLLLAKTQGRVRRRASGQRARNRESDGDR